MAIACECGIDFCGLFYSCINHTIALLLGDKKIRSFFITECRFYVYKYSREENSISIV